MIKHTLLHLPGIGRETEFRLWRSGILDWKDLLETRLATRPEVRGAIEASGDALEKNDVGYFFSLLPSSERWRVFPDFGPRFAAVDIETTGLSIYDALTVVGVEIDGEYQVFIRGSNLEDAVPILESALGLLTFNGTLFDLPFLRRTFPGIRLPSVHLDLRFLGRRVALRGPLKEVERIAGFHRPRQLEDLGGYAATVLWSKFEHGDLPALELLVEYNAADTCVLRPLCWIMVERLRGGLADAVRAAERQYSLFESKATSFLSAGTATEPTLTLPVIVAHSGTLAVNGSQVDVPDRRWEGPAITIETLLNRMSNPASRIVGIDLSGSEARPSGWALAQGDLVVSGALGATDDILRHTIDCKPDLVSIDSPLTIPEGRDCTSDECACRKFGISRACERELRKRGISVYWCLVPSMQALTRRGIEIASKLRDAGINVIESYPGAAQDIMRIPRKRASQAQLKAGLAAFGLRGIRALELITHDELDAITSAVVGAFYLANMHEALGSDSEGYLIVPSLTETDYRGDRSLLKRSVPSGPLVFVLTGAAAQEAAEQVPPDMSVPCVRSLFEAKERLRRGESVLVLASEPGAYDPFLALLGPRARCISVPREDARRGRRQAIFCDLVLDIESPDFASRLRSWLGELAQKGDAPCQ